MDPLAEKMIPVSRRLDAVRKTIRRLFALDGAARLALAVGIFLAAVFAVDWTLILPAPVRLAALAGGVLLAGTIAWRRLVRPLRVRISDDDLAVLVERRHPALEDRLISAVQLSREPATPRQSPELVEALVKEAGRTSAGMDFGRVVVRRRVGRRAFAAAVLAALLATGAALSPELASIYFNRLLGGSRRWPQRTRLRVLDFENRSKIVARGDDLAIAVACEGVRPSKVALEYAFEGGESGREWMSPLQGGRFQCLFPRLTGPFTFVVKGGDDVTEEHSVRTLDPPSLESVRVFLEYPPYMRRADTPPDRPETSGNVVAPFHTKVRFEALANEDLKAAAMTLGSKGKERTTPLEVAAAPDGRRRSIPGAFTVDEPYGEYSLQVTAVNGLTNRDPIRFTVRGVEDRPPEIVVLDPQGDEFVTDLCARPLEAGVKDDYGISRIALEHRIRAQQARDWASLDFTREQNSRDYGETAIRSRHVLDISRMGLQPGDHVELRFRAEDYKDVGGRNVRLSRVYQLSVVPIGTLEKDLQDAIEKVKLLLRAQKTRQETAWKRTARLIENYGRTDLLSQEQRGEVRQAALEQNDITSRLDIALRDVRHIQRRGVYNKVFNESAAAQLQGAIDELDPLTGDPADLSKPGISRSAAAQLDQASRLKTGAGRTAALRDGQGRQSAVAAGIQKALDFLEKWSSYQEVVRAARELLDRQKRVIEEIKGGK